MGRPARVRREEVLLAARAAFSARGYDGTTLAAIAARVGLSPAALLRHAPTKAALFSAAMAPVATAGPFPLDFLARADPQKPRAVLRRVARVALPFIEANLSESIACWMYDQNAPAPVLRLPFDPRAQGSPPRRAFALLEDYIHRAMRARTLRVRDAQAAAMAFMGSLNAYVFFHRVVRLVDPPIPRERYIDVVVDVWSRGALAKGRGKAS